MPFRPAFRWSPRTHSTRLADMRRLCADARVHRLFEWFSRHEREIADFQLAITTIPAPPFGEQARAAWLAERLQQLGLNLLTDAAGNVLASRAGLGDSANDVGESSGSHPAACIAISAHLDTVFPATTTLDVRREQSILHGPGISDNGAGLAALWALAAALDDVGLRTTSPLLFIANVGEEGEGDLRGIRHIYRERLHEAAIADGCPAPNIATLIALDGAGTANIVSQALGSRRFEILISGPGGHSWSDYGVANPLVAASLAVAALSRLPLPATPRATLNVGSIEGGTSVNAIPARAVIKVDLRSSDSRHLDNLERQLRQAVAQACEQTDSSASAGATLQHSITRIGSRPAGELSSSSPLLAAVRAVDTQLGIQAQTQLASTDANIPISLGLEAVSLGAGGTGGGAHTLGEWFDPAGREQALQRLALLVLLLAGLPQDE
jgi:tripeptide aminopeptidase